MTLNDREIITQKLHFPATFLLKLCVEKNGKARIFHTLHAIPIEVKALEHVMLNPKSRALPHQTEVHLWKSQSILERYEDSLAQKPLETCGCYQAGNNRFVCWQTGVKFLGQSLSVAMAIILHLDLYLCVLFKASCSCVLHRNISRHHDSIMLWLTKWLLFRLMFASGLVKLTYMDKTWWDLSALNWHYESQVSNQLCFWC